MHKSDASLGVESLSHTHPGEHTVWPSYATDLHKINFKAKNWYRKKLKEMVETHTASLCHN